MNSEKYIPDNNLQNLSYTRIQNFYNYKTDKVYADSLPAEGFSVKYDPNDEYLAIGCYNGSKLLYNLKDRKLIETLECPKQDAVTCIKWRPTAHTATKVLGVANSAGFFDYLHIPSLKKLFTIQEKDNSIHCCDFSLTGKHFATAGKDCHIRIYDQNTKSMSVDLGCAQWNYRGHSNRIFSIKFIDDNTIVSGGWDSVLHLWDVRLGKSVKAVFGPHIAGDSLDYKNGQLLLGCYASKNQIQIWDYNKFQMKQGITWNSSQQQEKSAYVYTATFDNYRPNTIVSGACGLNEAKVFHKQGGTYGVSTLIRNLDGGCFSVDTRYKESEFSLTTAKNSLFTFKESQ